MVGGLFGGLSFYLSGGGAELFAGPSNPGFTDVEMFAGGRNAVDFGVFSDLFTDNFTFFVGNHWFSSPGQSLAIR